MSDIPLHYQTAYQWTGETAAGETSIDGSPLLPVGSPHDSGRYSPEHLLVVAAETCLANYVLLLAGLSRIEVKDYSSTAEGELIQEDRAGYRFKRIVIRPSLTRGGRQRGTGTTGPAEGPQAVPGCALAELPG